MTSQYLATAKETYADIAAAGGDVVFTATFAGNVTKPFTGKAIQLEDDPAERQQLQQAGITLKDPVKLMVAAWNLGTTPKSGMPMRWAGVTYAVKAAESLNPDGQQAIYWTVWGGR